ncbi:D-alanyl-D-alanine carboxypeptidase/D-alanyl-D-alanine endopeptidase [Nocardioides dongkuii]|uniref:D-alanyl-D-alanine carboxypeptidase/D-alanyl-D-alanine endopeptidase n=1 Tax=Nocardioides dongkuii TaxID=2760089 RepID=UPI0015FE54EF|nr:D-alanyl-D-alanine carboxypeptidase/D-alanyl-D-alanine-endopeptidase [Nocardioides dongkuii]
MVRRDAGHGARTEAGRLRTWLALLVVLALTTGIAATYRYDLADRWFPRDPAGPVDPAAVAPPSGLDLPALVAPSAVAAPVAARPPDEAAVRRALAPYLRDRDLGRHVLAAVGGLRGPATYSLGGGTAIPASTTKLLTGLAALSALGPTRTFETRVVRTGRRVVLVGGGDPFLASTPPTAEDPAWPARADVTTLAKQTARALLADGVSSVRVGYDDSLFTGPAVNPHWPADYLPDGVVAPITALWVDEGRPATGVGRVEDPSRSAGQVFAAALRDSGITTVGDPGTATAPAGATPVAEVRSAPLDQIVEQSLLVSDNEATEVLLRHVGLAAGGEASSAAGGRGVREVLRDLGVPVTGLVLHDGSGLSRENRIAPATLLGVLRQAATGSPALRSVLGGLPVAAFSGSLAGRFDQGAPEGRGRVRAKTGTLTGVSSLAGIATSVDGTPMLFVLMADRIRPENTLDARAAIDGAAAALGACACAGTVVP